MDYQLFAVVGLAILIIGAVISLSRKRPESRIRQALARADWLLEAQDVESARELLEATDEPFALVQDEAERRDLRSEIDRRLGSIALLGDDYDEAERRLTSAVDNCDTLLLSRDPSSVGPLGNLALVRFEQGNDLEADATFERILEYEPNEYGPELTATAEIQRELAMACVVRDSYRFPERLLLRALEHLDERCDPTGDRRVRAWLNLAQVRMVIADYRGTRDALEQACWLANDESDYPTFSFVRGHLAILACEWGEAEEQFRTNHQFACEALGERSNDAAEALGGLAELSRVQGRFSAARDISRDALEIAEECWGEEHSQIAYYLLRQSMICVHLGDFRRAEIHLNRAIELARLPVRRMNSLLGVLYLVKGLLELERERPDAAVDSLEQARQISGSVYGRGHRLTMDSIMILGDVRLSQGRVSESAQLAEQALSICREHGQTAPFDQVDLFNLLARVRLAQGDLKAANQALVDAGALVDRYLNREHYAHAEVLHGLGCLRQHEGQPEEAEQAFRESLEIQERVRLPQHPVIARLLDDYAELLAETRRAAEAANLRSRAANIRAKLNNPGE